MKSFTIYFVIVLGITNMVNAQGLTKIEIVSQTRGGNKSIVVIEDSVSFTLNNNVSRTKLLTNEWEELNELVKEINFMDISSYTSSKSDRARDAAWHSNLSISTNTNKYTSTSFDDAHAPKELLPVVQFLLELDKKHNLGSQRIY